MELILIAAFLLAGGLLNFVKKGNAEFVCGAARVFIVLVAIVMISSWLFYFAGFKNKIVNDILGDINTWGKYSERLLLGYLFVNILISLKTMYGDYPLKKIIGLTLIGASILIGFTFLTATVGKATNMAEMIKFFTGSGYAVWFLYFIMAAETLGGIGVLLHFKLKTGPFAAMGLMLIMAGAVYTHWHNGDPFSDSYAAVSQFISLLLLLSLYRFDKLANQKTAAVIT